MFFTFASQFHKVCSDLFKRSLERFSRMKYCFNDKIGIE